MDKMKNGKNLRIGLIIAILIVAGSFILKMLISNNPTMLPVINTTIIVAIIICLVIISIYFLNYFRLKNNRNNKHF